MSTTHITTAQAFYARLAAGEMEAFFELLSPEVVAIAPGSRARIPWAGTWTGHAGFGDMMRTLSEHVVIEAYATDRFVDDGESRVYVTGTERVRTVRAGHVVETAWVHELTFHEGVLARFVEHYDTDAMAVALAG